MKSLDKRIYIRRLDEMNYRRTKAERLRDEQEERLRKHHTCTSSRKIPLFLNPHYTNELFKNGVERTVFLDVDDKATLTEVGGIKGLYYEYSDRIISYNPTLAQESWDRALAEGHTPCTADMLQSYLRHFFGKEITLRHVIAGVNISTGYSYLVYGFENPPTLK